ncbi:hypothetical protein Tco_0714558 [Tanacetum coccineum]
MIRSNENQEPNRGIRDNTNVLSTSIPLSPSTNVYRSNILSSTPNVGQPFTTTNASSHATQIRRPRGRPRLNARALTDITNIRGSSQPPQVCPPNVLPTSQNVSPTTNVAPVTNHTNCSSQATQVPRLRGLPSQHDHMSSPINPTPPVMLSSVDHFVTISDEKVMDKMDEDNEWLMAPVTPPRATMTVSSTYEVGGPSTAMPYRHGVLTRKMEAVSDIEVANSMAIGEIHPRVTTMEKQVQTLRTALHGAELQNQQLRPRVTEMESREGTMMSYILWMEECLTARKYIKRGCHLFLAHVTKKKKSKKRLEDVPVIHDFPKVFLDNLSGLPPPRQVEFKIDLVQGAALVARAPYRLAPTEMKEWSEQLKELLEKGFIRPSS